MYTKLLGVNIEVEMYEWPVFNAAVEKGGIPSKLYGLGAEYNDPFCMLSLLRSDANAIGTGWANEEYDKLIDLAAKEMDQEKTYRIF